MKPYIYCFRANVDELFRRLVSTHAFVRAISFVFLLYTSSLAIADTTWTYNSAADVPLSGNGFTASGSITLALNFTPETGTNLHVVNNTSRNFIINTFSNLVQGQEVTLSFDGVGYRFFANYYGGTGNDLILVWADVHPVSCGENYYGALGRDNTGTQSILMPVTSGVLAGKTVVAMSAGQTHSVALCADGTVASWGSNFFGELGNNGEDHSSIPVSVDQSGALAGRTVIAVSAGFQYSLALCSDGTVAAWGNNSNGELGNNSTTSSPVPVAVYNNGVLAGKSVIAISAGYFHCLALCSDGTVVAWGDNSDGEFGDNTSDSYSTVPVATYLDGVLAGKTIISVSAGKEHSLALCSDGTIAAWGWNFEGQLGDGTWTRRKIPVEVVRTGILSGKTAIELEAGAFHSLARCSDGTVVAWGGKTLMGS